MADGEEGHGRGQRRAAPPLDPETFDRMALDYVARYATSRAKLIAYLRRKLRDRGWVDEGMSPDPEAVAARMAALRFVDDAAFATARAGSLARRGYGGRRVAQALSMAGIDEADRSEAMAATAAGAWDAALAYARRRRLGPYAAEPAEGDAARRALASMIRAGHDFATARAIIAASPGCPPDRPED